RACYTLLQIHEVAVRKREKRKVQWLRKSSVWGAEFCYSPKAHRPGKGDYNTGRTNSSVDATNKQRSSLLRTALS
ncbi:MAG: hypothetical protein ACK4UN_04345, partial [Limisphaerales bacterium]